jgi:carbon monoxide dehydrogenase subunit G
MVYVDRRNFIKSATPEAVATLLFDAESLIRVLPRMRKAELFDHHEDGARLVFYLSLGNLLGTHRFDGMLARVGSNEVRFFMPRQRTAEIRWIIDPDVEGVYLRVAMSLELAALLGPMSHFLPRRMVEDMIANEIDQAFQELSHRFEHPSTPNVCPIPQLCLLSPQALLA